MMRAVTLRSHKQCHAARTRFRVQQVLLVLVICTLSHFTANATTNTPPQPQDTRVFSSAAGTQSDDSWSSPGDSPQSSARNSDRHRQLAQQYIIAFQDSSEWADSDTLAKLCTPQHDESLDTPAHSKENTRDTSDQGKPLRTKTLDNSSFTSSNDNQEGRAQDAVKMISNMHTNSSEAASCRELCPYTTILHSLGAIVTKMTDHEWRRFFNGCPAASEIEYMEVNQPVAHVAGVPPESEHHPINKGVENEEEQFSIHAFQGRSDNQPGRLGWNLDRLDQRNLPLDQKYQPDSKGADAVIYVVDSGIRASHEQFLRKGGVGSRVETAANFVGDGQEFIEQGGDCYGHGTIVASISAGNTAGVAPEAHLVSVRVLDCEGLGTVTDVVEGLEWIARTHRQRGRPGVVTLSLGLLQGSASRVLERAVRYLMSTNNITVVTAAGNFNRVLFPVEGSANGDACGLSPSNVPATITTAASAADDSVWPFSNTGRCVDIFAPGVQISGASHRGDHRYSVWSGTSMAVPHVAGAAAISLKGSTRMHPAQVKQAILERATRNHVFAPVTSMVLGRTPNQLLYLGTHDPNNSPLGDGGNGTPETSGGGAEDALEWFQTMAAGVIPGSGENSNVRFVGMSLPSFNT